MIYWTSAQQSSIHVLPDNMARCWNLQSFEIYVIYVFSFKAWGFPKIDLLVNQNMYCHFDVLVNPKEELAPVLLGYILWINNNNYRMFTRQDACLEFTTTIQFYGWLVFLVQWYMIVRVFWVVVRVLLHFDYKQKGAACCTVYLRLFSDASIILFY